MLNIKPQLHKGRWPEQLPIIFNFASLEMVEACGDIIGYIGLATGPPPLLFSNKRLYRICGGLKFEAGN